jgi:hypothetical protein
VARLIGVDHKTVYRVRAQLEAVGEIPQLTSRRGEDGKTYSAGQRKPAVLRPAPDAKRQADLEAKRAKTQAKQEATKAEEQADLAQLVEDWTARGGAVRASLKPQARTLATQDRIKAAMNDCILALTRALNDPGLDEDLVRAERALPKDFQINEVRLRLGRLLAEFGRKLDALKRAEQTSRMAQEAPVRET